MTKLPRGLRCRSCIVIVILCGIFSSSDSAMAQGGQNPDTVLINANIIDCTGSPIQKSMTLVISGNKIASISKESRPQAGEARVIDLAGGFVLPGFWNMHTHLSTVFPDNPALAD